jgi:toxin YoeB
VSNSVFDSAAVDDLAWWVQQDRKKAIRVLELILDLRRDPFGGKGKPEALKHELAGCWSRRIDQEHRLVYQILGREGDRSIFSADASRQNSLSRRKMDQSPDCERLRYFFSPGIFQASTIQPLSALHCDRFSGPAFFHSPGRSSLPVGVNSLPKILAKRV